MSKKKGKSNQPETLKREIIFEIYGIVILTLSLITMASYGAIGRNLTYLCRFVVGTWDFVIPIFAAGLAVYIMVKRDWPRTWSPRLSGLVILLLAVLTYIHYATFHERAAGQTGFGIVDKTWEWLLAERNSPTPTDVGSGMTGAVLYALLHFLFDDTGTLIVLAASVLTGLLLLTGFSYLAFFRIAKKRWNTWKEKAKEDLADWLRNTYAKKRKRRKRRPSTAASSPSVNHQPVSERPVIHDFADRSYDGEQPVRVEQLTLPLEIRKKKKEEPPLQEAAEESMTVSFEPEVNPDYRMPSLSLLRKGKKRNQQDREELWKSADILVEKLANFGVQATVTDIRRGPSVTRYEIQPDPGVKVSRIVSLADDIALALAAKAIRIEAPIPGKSAVGIEVPNPDVEMVNLRDVLESAAYQHSPSKLSIALGMDISGEPIVDNLAKMPHLLVAGATGSGKSVCINAIISSLLFKARPEEVKLMMIDPKMVELNMYNGIPHLLIPVVTDPRKAAVALKKVVAEMEKRYEIFAKHGARDIERFNQLVADKKPEGLSPLPYIVVIVDELADLMMVAPHDVEDAICRLAQMARAAGIHLIIATQRPSVDVITGIIKANIPARIAFAVSSQVDSRTILGTGGAEKLLGKGDMLYLPPGAPKPVRVQGAFVSDEEVEALVRFVSTQQEPHYQEELIPGVTGSAGMEWEDDLYPQAVKLVLETKTASVSLIQRRLRVGYTRAARLIDMMEANGIVGPYEGSKPREVLITLEQYEENKTVVK
jgi:S-DNA-T family DNA segregation ATPase FtsK/SpoIIIE